jgi:hypothetical protein
MTIASGNFAELLWPGIADRFGTSYERYPKLYPKIFNIKRATKRFEKVQGVTGLPLASIKSEGQAINYSDPMQGFQKEYVMVVYALGTTITREMVDDEQYGYINEVPSMLSDSLVATEETVCFNHLNRAFNTAYTGADGSIMIVGTHTFPTGRVYSNVLTTAADLNQTSIEAMLAQIQLAVDDQGIPIRLMPRALVIHPENNFRARKILESGNVTGNNDNDVNPIPGLFNDLVVSPYLTDTDAWFVTTSARNGLTFFERDASEIRRDNEFDTQNLKIAIRARFDSGWSNPLGIYGTPGV